jgi:hypothetical protein
VSALAAVRKWADTTHAFAEQQAIELSEAKIK